MKEKFETKIKDAAESKNSMIIPALVTTATKPNQTQQ